MHVVNCMFAAALGTIVVSGQARLEPYGLDMVNCYPGLTTPCFRLQFRILGGQSETPDGVTATASNRDMQVIDTRLAGEILQVTGVSPYPDLASLGGRSVDFAVSWQRSDGTKTEGFLRWASGDMGAVLSAACDATEKRKAPKYWSSMPQWRQIGVFLGCSGLLAIAMFLVPRQVWRTAPAGIRPVRRGPARNTKIG